MNAHKNPYKIDFSAGTITITSACAKAMNNPESAEYKAIAKIRRDFPEFEIINKTHARPSSYTNKQGEKFHCNQFKNLTYKNMEAFINGLPDGDDYLMPYNFIKTCGSLPLTSRYTAVRRWFVAQFPEFRKNPLFYLYNKPTVLETLSFIQEAKKEAEENALEKAG